MSKELSSESFIFHTDIGMMMIKVSDVQYYDIEDIVRDKSVSQARAVQLMNLGKGASANQPTVARTKSSVYFKNEEELK